MAETKKPTPETEADGKETAKKFGVEPTQQPDTSVHQFDRGIKPSADAPEPRAQL